MPALEPVAERLRGILEPYRDRLQWVDSGRVLSLQRPGGNPQDFFAGVRVGKRYVSYYLMPVYTNPELLEEVSPGLRGRMQGKSCFNFTSVDEGLLRELRDLTERGWARFSGAGAAG